MRNIQSFNEYFFFFFGDYYDSSCTYNIIVRHKNKSTAQLALELVELLSLKCVTKSQSPHSETHALLNLI